jgi:3'-phosphoadenosine 5'-phosphosulfate sulfotransferase (PAPS reductase)/FAD synthetase
MDRAPLIVAYGMGVDSTAMLVGLHQRGERPDLITFADTGDEKAETYAYLPTINAWLDSVGFPRVTVVKNARPVSGDKSLSDSCMRLGVLPALAYGQHQCSLVWKRDPQQKFVKGWAPAIAAWAAGQTVTQCIGYDAGPRDSCRSYKAEGKASPGYTNRFPLIEWGWDREECVRQIAAAGLPVPVKSACFHCPASKQHEIVWLKRNAPEQFAKAIQMEALAMPKILARKAEGKKVSTKGLGRTFAWTDRAGAM